MYSDFDNQLANLLRYGCSFIILFVLWPGVLFRGGGERGLDAFMSGYVKMVFLTIAVGYVLVFIKLYELIALVTVLLFATFYSRFLAGGRKWRIKETRERLVTAFYDTADGVINPLKMLPAYLSRAISPMKAAWAGLWNLYSAGTFLLILAVIAYSAFLRFYDAVFHAAPAMSDAYVTLAWMKYIEARLLFHDGIYPHGFHIYLSLLHKFSATDHLYALKYTGPLNGVLMTLGIYFTVSRIAGRAIPGIVAAFVFGIAGDMLPIDWERQSSTNSQEFALVFLFPGLYYAYSYLRTAEKKHLWPAAACFTIIGWVHSLVFAFTAMGVLLIILAHLVSGFRQYVRPALNLSLLGAASGALSAVPLGIGLIMGKSFHRSSSDFLTAQIIGVIPDMTPVDMAALAAITIFFLVTAVFRKHRDLLGASLFILFLGLSSFWLYMLSGSLTGNAVLVTRSGLFWGMVIPPALGFGWFAVFRLLNCGSARGRAAEVILCSVLMALAVFYLRPEPAIPYKMQHESTVEQYLRISREFRPTQWMIVSAEEEYPLALGRGWHMMLGDFLKWYDPEEKRLLRMVDGREEVLSTQDIFIFREKKLFTPGLKEMEPIIERRKKEYEILAGWLDKYRATHDNASVYYEDEKIQVTRIHQPRSKEEKFKEIWGENRYGQQWTGNGAIRR